jgi:hypothetical protein
MWSFARIWLVVALGCVVSACSKEEKAPPPAASTTPSAAPAESSALVEPEIVHTRLITCSWTGKYADSFGENVAEFECKSHAAKPLRQVAFWVYYYDKDGKQLERYLSSVERTEGVVFAPGATVKLALGKSRGREPIYTKAIEVEAFRGVYSDGRSWENPTLAPEERPLSEASERRRRDGAADLGLSAPLLSGTPAPSAGSSKVFRKSSDRP